MRAFRTEPRPAGRSAGFTMAELILVMLILSVLAVTALPRLDAGLGMAGSANRDELIAALRRAHSMATTSRRPVCVTVINTRTTTAVSATASPADCGAAGVVPQGAVGLLFQADGTVAQSSGNASSTADSILLDVQNEAAVTVYVGSGHVE